MTTEPKHLASIQTGTLKALVFKDEDEYQIRICDDYPNVSDLNTRIIRVLDDIATINEFVNSNPDSKRLIQGKKVQEQLIKLNENASKLSSDILHVLNQFEVFGD